MSLLVFTHCSRDANPLILYDFESDAELDHLYWNCHTLYALSEDHATHGTKSLRMELFPSDYPGFVPLLDVTNWRGYRELSFDLYNPSGRSVRIEVRIDDRKDYPGYRERFNRTFVLGRGNNHIVIPLKALVTSGSGRFLNLATIGRVYVFMKHPAERTTLYLDAFSLTKS